MRGDVTSALDGLDQLDVGGCHWERGHGCRESLVGGEHAGLESDGEREVQRVIDRPAGGVREFVRVGGEHTARNRFYRNSADVIDELAALFGGQLTTADFLPDRIGRLRKEKVRGEVLVREHEQATRRVSVNLRNKPFDHDAGVDDERAHLVSRSSRIRAALSVCVGVLRRFSHRPETRRVSAMLLTLAFRRTAWISAWRDLPCAFAAAFSCFKTLASRSRTRTFAISLLLHNDIIMIPLVLVDPQFTGRVHCPPMRWQYPPALSAKQRKRRATGPSAPLKTGQLVADVQRQ